MEMAVSRYGNQVYVLAGPNELQRYQTTDPIEGLTRKHEHIVLFERVNKGQFT